MVRQVGGNLAVAETGNPRMDLLRPELRAIYQDRADAIKATYGQFILIASNFAWNNHFMVDDAKESPTEAYIRLLKRQGHIVTAADEEFHKANLEYKAEVFDRLKRLVHRLSESFPELRIVVRPHPSENHENWKASMKGLENVDVLYEGELESWILAAKAVIHNSCTSGLLAALLNRKSIAFMPFGETRFEHELPNGVSAKARTEDEVVALVDASPMRQDFPDLLQEHISSLTGALASERIADRILEAYKPGLAGSALALAMAAANALTGPFARQASERSDAAEGDEAKPRKKGFKTYKKQKFEEITAAEVVDNVNIYRRLLGRFDDIDVRESGAAIEIRTRKGTGDRPRASAAPAGAV